MSYLEIVQIRTAKINQKLLNEFLNTWFSHVIENEKLKKVKIYKHLNLETDYSVHIELNDKANNNDDKLGESLVLALKEFGIVNHSVWVEQ